ncbi:ankyrin repeat-containing domain protein [Xylaria sp. FL0043]|nr:ankyrin repeat-containing domain protein [Xylaria sp. FL0043]
MTMRDPRDDVTYYLKDLDKAWLDYWSYTYRHIFLHDETEFAIAALIVAARSGTAQLLLYLNSIAAELRDFRTILLEAALSLTAGLGDVVAIRAMGEAKVDPNARTLLSKISVYYWLDFHPVIRAAKEKRSDAVRLLIEMGSEMRSETDIFNPLSTVIRARQLLPDVKRMEYLETVKYSLGQNLASVYGRDAMVQAIVPSYTQKTDSGWRPRSYDFKPDEEIIDMLLEAGVALNDIKVEDKDLLHSAIDRSCDLRTVEILVSRGAEIHSRPCLLDGKTMLHSAAASLSEDRQRIVEWLLRSGADCRAEYGGLTILGSALSVEDDEEDEGKSASSLQLFSLLLERGAQLNGPPERLPEERWGCIRAPLVTRLLHVRAPDELILQAIQAGADINSLGRLKSWDPWHTPLQYAIKWGRPDVARQLIARGADINAPAHGKFGCTALQAAFYPEFGVEIDVQFIQFLLDSGADINAPGARDCGLTALQCAVEVESMGAVCLLLDAGAHIFGTVEYSTVKSSALGTAAEQGSRVMVDMMLKRLAGNTKCGREPYEDAARAAERWRHFAIARRIRESIAKPVAG